MGVPLPQTGPGAKAKALWTNVHVHRCSKKNEKPKTNNQKNGKLLDGLDRSLEMGIFLNMGSSN